MSKAPPVLFVSSPSGHLWIERQGRTLLEGAAPPCQHSQSYLLAIWPPARPVSSKALAGSAACDGLPLLLE